MNSYQVNILILSHPTKVCDITSNTILSAHNLVQVIYIYIYIYIIFCCRQAFSENLNVKKVSSGVWLLMSAWTSRQDRVTALNNYRWQRCDWRQYRGVWRNLDRLHSAMINYRRASPGISISFSFQCRAAGDSNTVAPVTPRREERAPTTLSPFPFYFFFSSLSCG